MPRIKGILFSKVKVGDRHGKLVVVSREGTDKWGKPLFKQRCDCGTVKVGAWKSAVSCGCERAAYLKRINTLKRSRYGEANAKRLFYGYRKGARDRKHVFEITFDLFLRLTKQDCFYCGAPPSFEARYNSESFGGYVYNGIDRVESTIGYVEGNVVACCRWCNYAKHTRLQPDFYRWAVKLAENLKKKGLVL